MGVRVGIAAEQEFAVERLPRLAVLRGQQGGHLVHSELYAGVYRSIRYVPRYAAT